MLCLENFIEKTELGIRSPEFNSRLQRRTKGFACGNKFYLFLALYPFFFCNNTKIYIEILINPVKTCTERRQTAATAPSCQHIMCMCFSYTALHFGGKSIKKLLYRQNQNSKKSSIVTSLCTFSQYVL